jgi:hypothetical protein
MVIGVSAYGSICWLTMRGERRGVVSQERMVDPSVKAQM